MDAERTQGKRAADIRQPLSEHEQNDDRTQTERRLDANQAHTKPGSVLDSEAMTNAAYPALSACSDETQKSQDIGFIVWSRSHRRQKLCTINVYNIVF